MSRRSNLNTLRKHFSWNSNWTVSSEYYTQVVWFDLKITAFLHGLFYVLRMPSSSYIIRRFLNSFVIIEADIWLFDRACVRHFLHNISYFSYLLYKLRRLWCRDNLTIRYCDKYKTYSARSIVYQFICKLFKNVHIKKKRTISKRKPRNLYDVRTLRKNNVFTISDRIINKHPFVLKRTKSKSKYRSSSESTLSKDKQNAAITWSRAAGISAINSVNFSNKRNKRKKRNKLNVYKSARKYRAVAISTHRYNLYFKRYLRNKLARYNKFVRTHKYMSVHRLRANRYRYRVRKLARVLCRMHSTYSEYISDICATTKLCYLLRNRWFVALSFRLSQFYMRHMLRGSVFISINSQLSRIDSVTGDADVLAALPLNRKTSRKRMHFKLLGL